jgi:hypothetical protein
MADDAHSKIELHFYRSGSGNEPVREWLKDQDEADRRAIGLDLMRVQYRWPAACGKSARLCPREKYRG